MQRRAQYNTIQYMASSSVGACAGIGTARIAGTDTDRCALVAKPFALAWRRQQRNGRSHSHLETHDLSMVGVRPSTLRLPCFYLATALRHKSRLPIRAGLQPPAKPPSSDMMLQLELDKRENFKAGQRSANVIFWILLLNIGVYVADHLLKFQPMKYLYLYHDLPQWFQFFTATFCHINWRHLSSNLFFLYIFGKLVEEEEGGFALWASYLATGAGANFVSWLLLPKSVVSVGASGAVFGLFAISVLVKISFNWRKILEVLILGQFVIEKVMEAAEASVDFVGNRRYYFATQNINHLAHLSGALIGVALIWLLSQIPSGKNKDQ